MKLNLEATRVHFDLVEDIRRVNLLRGGTRSSKSFSLMQLVFIWFLTGRIGKYLIPVGNFIIVRATMPALRATVMKDWNEYLVEQDMYGRVDHRKTTNTYYYKRRKVEFLSVDDEEKLKGRQSTMFWINESDAVEFSVFNHLLMRCEKFCWLDINPSNSDSWLRLNIEEDRMQNRDDVSLHISTYLDNPYLNEEMIKEIMNLKLTDIQLWKVYTLGEWAKLSGKILNNWDTIDADELPEDLKFGYGLDFGFANDPSALIRCSYDKDDNILYLQQVIYEKELLNSEIIDIIKEECLKSEPIVADSAEPKSIRELQMKGVRCIPSVKGKDSVKHGLNKLRQTKILVTSESIDLILELQRYKWKLDALGEATNKPIEKYNHAIDAVRYWYSKAIVKLKVS